jgi:peroxiredoxin
VKIENRIFFIGKKVIIICYRVDFTKVIIKCNLYNYSIFGKKRKQTKMKRIYLFLLIAVLTGSISFSQEKKVYDEGYVVKIGDVAPDFTVSEAGGKTYKLSDLRGKVVMLQFTASWCSVCRKEMPFIEKEIWQEKKTDGLVVIGIDRDEPFEKVLSFKKDMAVTYPLALDPGADIFALYALKEAGVTRNVIIDRSGKIVFLTRLFDREEFDKMKKVIFAQLSVK